ncbi:PREDICTED: uncharacterized protein LOC103771711, partial [Merops nubicus]|uniref:uncharacterized protein LOC103771711 n=1 Tax=Merops nubicus TaxID=57421 RepID=UPI0004F08AD8
KAHAHVVYPLIPCPCEDLVTFGCLVNDFFPQPSVVSWISSTSGVNRTFPVVQGGDGYYGLSATFTLPVDDLEDKNFRCQVVHPPTGVTTGKEIKGLRGGHLDGLEVLEVFVVAISMIFVVATLMGLEVLEVFLVTTWMGLDLLQPFNIFLVATWMGLLGGHLDGLEALKVFLVATWMSLDLLQPFNTFLVDTMMGLDLLQGFIFSLVATWMSLTFKYLLVDHLITPILTSPSPSLTSGEDICPTNLSVTLLSDPHVDNPSEEKVLLLCLVEGHGAGKAQVQWLKNNQVMETRQEVNTCERCSEEKATFSSKVNVSRKSWDLGARFSCKVTHPSLKKPVVENISSFCS